LADDRIFAVVARRCVHRGGYGRAAILSESLASGSCKLIGRAPKDALALGASEDRVAIAALDESEAPAVTVGSARSGRRLYRAVGGSAETGGVGSLAVS